LAAALGAALPPDLSFNFVFVADFFAADFAVNFTLAMIALRGIRPSRTADKKPTTTTANPARLIVSPRWRLNHPHRPRAYFE
jgi:hypothetical protein